MRIVVDAMGGDHGPSVPVQAALNHAREGGQITLVGDEATVRAQLASLGGEPPPGLQIVHAPDVITMDEKPSRALRKRPECSLRVGARLVAQGQAEALVSAGNSGAVMGAGLMEVGRLKGVERPALASVFPTLGEPVVVLDLGANVDPSPKQLAQFAVLGAAYAEAVLSRPRPRVALLANGSEEGKGNDLTRAAHELLSQSPLDYRGYCEGGDVFTGGLDVIVVDGFTGNVLLKTLEGLVKMVRTLAKEGLQSSLLAGAGALLMKDLLTGLKDRFDYENAGGAPLLGLCSPVIIAHGASSAQAMQGAIRTAEALVRAGVMQVIADRVAEHAELW